MLPGDSIVKHGPFKLGSYLVEPGAHRVVGGGRSVRVEPKLMQVLVCFAAHPGQTLTRDDLLDKAWPEVYVGENALSRTISQLRKVLGDDPRRPQFIETIPTVGYRLIAPVEPVVPEPKPPYAGDSAPMTVDAIELPSYALRPQRTWSRLLLAGIGFVAVVVLLGTGWLLRVHQEVLPEPVTKYPLTALPGQEAFPALSPDGRQVAFVWDGGQGDNLDVYVKMIGDEQPLRLTDHPAPEIKTSWTPDGRYIAFWRQAEGDDCGVFLVSPLGGVARKLTDCTASRQGVAFSPDGRWIVMTERPAPTQPRRLYRLHLETQQGHALTRPPEPYLLDLDPVYSPDGRHVAFSRNMAPGIGDLYVVPVDGGDPTRLTFDNRYVSGITWTPDGRHVLFASNRTGFFQLWQVPFTGGTPVWMSNIDAFDPGHLSFSADGRWLAYEEWSVEKNIVQVPLESAGEAVRVVRSSQWDYEPSVSQDGAHLAFISNRSGNFEVWTSRNDGQDLQQVTNFEGAYVSSPRWSPDGRYLAFSVRQDDSADLYRVDARGGRPRLLSQHAEDEVLPTWSADGRWLYFASNRSGLWQVWKMPADGGVAQQVTEAGGYYSFEGKRQGEPYLFYTKPGVAGLWGRAVHGGPEQRILLDLAPEDAANWTLANERVYYLRRSDQGPVVAALHLATGKTHIYEQVLSNLSSTASGLAISPEGSWLYHTAVDRLESDLVLVEWRH